MKRWLKRALVALCSATLALTATALVGCSSCKKDKACEHEWQETVVTAATCTSDGAATRTCTKCGESEDVTIPAAHALETVVVEATCTERGSKTTKCTVCDYENEETLVATGHSYAVSNEVAATCTVQGYNEYTCANCDDAYTEITADKTGHDTLTAEWVIVGEGQAEGSCTWIQFEEATCATCGETVEHEEEIVKHEYSVEITKAATCSVEGEKTYTCDCGESYTEAFVNAGGHAWVAGVTDTATGITPWTCSNNAEHTKTSFSAKDQVAATIPASAIENAGEIELQNATIELPAEVKAQLKDGVDLAVDTLNTEDKNNAMANLSDEEQAKLANTEIFNFQMAQGDDAVTKFDKEITVTVPYTLEAGADPADIAVWYIDDNGQLTSIKATYSEVEGQGYATFATDHFSYYTVVRLSAKERCALYGCEETTTVVAATCEADGYTLTKCVRCNKTTRTNFVKALAHTYTESIFAPTCTAKGYTTYTCTREGCDYSYASKWVNMLAHEYEAKVTEPTCTAKGYTTHTCKTCGDAYTDGMVAAKGHAYVEGACTVCGKEDPSYIKTEEINFYFNAIEGLLTAETYYLELKDLNVKVTNIEYQNIVEAEYDVAETNVTMDVQAEVALDENDYLFGKGIMTLKESETYADQTEAVSGDVEAVFANGMIYIMAESEESNSGKSVMKTTVSQDELLNVIGVGSMMEMLVGYEPDEQITGIIESVKNTPNNPLNKAIATVMEYVYTKTETTDGYHFELNFDRVMEIYQILTEKKVNEVVDLVFSAGAYDAICNYLTTTVDKNVSVVVADLTNVLALWGIEIDVVYDVINAMVGGEGFDIRTMVAQYSEMKVSELLDGMMEAEEPMDYKAMITQYAEQLKQVTLADLAMMIVYNAVPSPGQGGGNMDMPYPEGDKMEIKQANAGATEEADVVYTTLVEIVEMLKKSSFSFETDKTGEVLSYTMKLINIGVDKTIDEIKAEIEAEISEDTHYYSIAYPLINGTMTIKPNGTMTGSFDNLITEAAKAEAVVENYWKALFEDAEEVEDSWRQTFYKDVVDGEIWEMYGEDRIDSQEDTYAGQPAIRISAYGNVVLVTSPSTVLETISDCIGWTGYYVQGIEYEDVEFTIWVNEEGKPLGIDVLFGSEESVGFCEVVEFYYNATTDTYVDGWRENGMHNFVEIEHKVAEGCEGRGYHKYSCRNCGKIETYYYTNGHDTEWGYALSEGATDCEGGVDRIETCTKCGKIVSRYKTGNGHFTYEFEQVVATTECGDVVMRGGRCACGKEQSFYDVEGPCIFDCVSKEDIENTETKWEHYLYTYRCAVNECAYTYTVESYRTQEGCCVYTYRIVKFGVEEGSTNVDYTFSGKTENYLNHLDWHDERTEKTDLGAGIYEIHLYCSACDYEEDYYLASYDENGNMIYYKSLEEGRIEEWEATYEDNSWGWKNYYRELGEYGDDGYTRVYNGCEYVQYDLAGNFEYEGDMHEWWNTRDPYSDSCTQYQFHGYYEYCYYCGETYREGGYSQPKDHDYYWDEELGLYVCGTCGMKSETGADAIVIEDLTYVNDGKVLTVGYYNRENKSYSVYVVVNYGTSAERYLVDVTCEDVVTYENSGLITINMEELVAAVESLAGTEYEVQTVSLVLQYFDPQSGEYDETTGEYEGSYIDCVVTFE